MRHAKQSMKVRSILFENNFSNSYIKMLIFFIETKELYDNSHLVLVSATQINDISMKNDSIDPKMKYELEQNKSFENCLRNKEKTNQRTVIKAIWQRNINFRVNLNIVTISFV